MAVRRPHFDRWRPRLSCARSSPRRHRLTMERPIELGAERQDKRLHFVAGDRGHHFSLKTSRFRSAPPSHHWTFAPKPRACGFSYCFARRRLSLLCRSSFASRRAPLPRGRSLSRRGLPSFRRRRFHSCHTSPPGSCGLGCRGIRLTSRACHSSLRRQSTSELGREVDSSHRPKMVGSQHPATAVSSFSVSSKLGKHWATSVE